MPVFYVPPNNINGNSLRMEGQEANHCAKVLRKAVGDVIRVVDGQGGMYQCCLSSVQPQLCEATVEYKQLVKSRPYHLTIAISPTKNSQRIEVFVEKAVEIGVDEVFFFHSKYTEKKKLRIDRLEKIAIAAMKQSGQAYLPKIHDLLTLNELLNRLSKDKKPNTTQLLATVAAKQKDFITNYLEPGQRYFIVIGPEGDFSNEELDKFRRFKLQAINLGKSILRVESAGIFCAAVCSVVNHQAISNE